MRDDKSCPKAIFTVAAIRGALIKVSLGPCGVVIPNSAALRDIASRLETEAERGRFVRDAGFPDL